MADRIASIRDTVSLRSERSRKHYVRVMAFALLLVYVFQVHIPWFLPPAIRAWPLWPQQYFFGWLVGVFWALFVWCAVLGNMMWYLFSISFSVFVTIYKFAVQDRVVIVPISPDGKGGVGKIGDLAFALTLVVYLAGMPFVLAWLVLYGADLSLLIGLVVYIVILIALFFGPLLSLHWSMKRARKHELERLAALYQHQYDRLPSDAKAQALGTDVSAQIALLSQLDRLYRRAEAMPIWPFDFSRLRMFITGVALPLAVYMVQSTTGNKLSEIALKWAGY